MEKIKELMQNKIAKIVAIAVILLLIIIIIIIGSSKRKKLKQCEELRNDIIAVADAYVNKNDLLPELNGTSITIDLSDLERGFSFKNTAVTGTITYTKYNDLYVKTTELKDASFCTTKKFKGESSKYRSDNNYKVNVYYNYTTVESYNSKYSSYIPSNLISKKETKGVLLPIDSKYLPTIPKDAVITEYVREIATFYSYRDTKWRWYANDVAYSEYSAEKPAGYTYKDEETRAKTKTSEWSLDYPETHEYRTIQSADGYQWYKLDGKKKIYWENGAYSVSSPGEGYVQDKTKTAKMYSYYDVIYRWYNGNKKRNYYEIASSVAPAGYKYKDDGVSLHTDWTEYEITSHLTESSKSYREERTKEYSRYLIKYDMYSYPIFEKPVSLEELEKKIGKSYKEILEDKSIKLEVIFKFQKEA